MAVIELEKVDKIATITFNRPETLHALSSEILQKLEWMLESLKQETQVSVVVLTGSGDKAFIAGADVQEMKSFTPSQASNFAKKGHDILFLLEQLPQITIAAINGFALGGGCEVAMTCDLIYAADHAQFGQPELNLGIIPGFGGTQRLIRLVGPMKAKEMIFTGAFVSAQEAKQIGLVADVFAQKELMQKVMNIAQSISKKDPQALYRAKKALYFGMDVDFHKACEHEQTQFALCFTSSNPAEGMEAFLKKRKPCWKTV